MLSHDKHGRLGWRIQEPVTFDTVAAIAIAIGSTNSFDKHYEKPRITARMWKLLIDKADVTKKYLAIILDIDRGTSVSIKARSGWRRAIIYMICEILRIGGYPSMPTCKHAFKPYVREIPCSKYAKYDDMCGCDKMPEWMMKFHYHEIYQGDVNVYHVVYQRRVGVTITS